MKYQTILVRPELAAASKTHSFISFCDFINLLMHVQVVRAAKPIPNSYLVGVEEGDNSLGIIQVGQPIFFVFVPLNPPHIPL